MLTLARESRSLSQSQLSKLTGIGQPILSKAENGVAALSPERLDIVSEVLDYPREIFDWADEHLGLGPSGFYHRKQSGLGQTALKRIEAEVAFLVMQLRRLERSVEIEPAHRLPVLDADEYSPEQAAEVVRATWLMPSGPVSNVVRLVERAGVVVVRRDLRSPKISALSINPPGDLPIIVLNTGMPADRERFTIMHEIGHMVMHQIPRDNGEKEADAFASAFLMPALDISPFLAGGMSIQKAAQLKQHWRTSMSSIIRCAHTLRKIDDAKYKSLMVQMSQYGYRKNEPGEVPQEEPTILGNVLAVFRDDHGYSEQELATVVGLKPREFHTCFGAGRRLRAV
ncbi:XRE family transcriptional regulator [Streptacidiphilus carbonis]|uniref:XRE family transcriptional regulator n=1 Tax=Streptacidiphilus carbonis TaxID=105422 RepID=UPI000693CE5D|nr:XRE family transcriptional regulator [Streptacidiphilus carbonis]